MTISPSPRGDGKGGAMQDSQDRLGRHPRGTLALVGLYGLVFFLGWLAIYFMVYIPRGGVHP